MKRFGLIAGCLVTLGAIGCADTHEFIRYASTETPRLASSDTFYIAVSRDGVYGAKVYERSGLTTSQILLASLAKRANRVEVARSPQSYDEASNATRGLGYRILVYPTILHWEDRATEWSAIPDRVEVKIELADVGTGQTLDSGVIRGKSGIATLGGDHPQDLLPLPVEEYFSQLFGPPSVK